MYELCGYRLNLSPHLDFSEAEIYISLNANPKPHIFQLYSTQLIKDKSDESHESHACVSESWRQHLGHKTLHLSGDTNSPCALWSLGAGAGHAAKTLCFWEAAPSLCTGAELLPCWRRRKGRSGQGVGAVLWLCGWHGKASSLLCSAARLCRLLRRLFKTAALSLQAHQTCEKSHTPVNKYYHTYFILDVLVSEFL